MIKHFNPGDRYGTTFTKLPQLGPLPQDAFHIPKSDVDRLRNLAQRKHDYALDTIMETRRDLWRSANDLQMKKPPICIYQICWAEMTQEAALQLQCTHPMARELEDDLLKELYCHEHGLGDVVIEDYIECPLYVYDSGFGIDEQVEVARTDKNSDIVSRHFNILIASADDIEKIKEPEIYLDLARTQQIFEVMCEIFGDIIPIKKVGARGQWFTPWDYLIRVMGIEETLINLYDEPEFIEATVKRYVDCSLLRAKRYSELGIWGSNNASCPVGSGGYGLTQSLAGENGLETGCGLKQMWGCGNAQIFSGVSPDMHWQFSLQYELDWLEQFGMTYYGCCEPLHNKLEMLQRIPNLRKVSMSPWSKLEVAAEICKDKYVMSCKPSPAIFATDVFDEAAARSQVLAILEKTQDCHLELIMKDISTVHYAPEKLARWAKIARETVDAVYGA